MKSLFLAVFASFLFNLLLLQSSDAQTYLLPSNGNNNISATDTVCSGYFYDDGGPTGNYSNGAGSLFGGTNRTVTFVPSVPGTKLVFTFTQFRLDPGGGLVVADILTVTNNGVSSTYGGTTSPGIVTSNAADGSLTFNLYIGQNANDSGWAATISLTGPVISYSSGPYCAAGSAAVTWSNGNPLTGGLFSASPSGLAIDPATGTVNLASSTTGTYTVDYTQGCYQTSTTINILPASTSSTSQSICSGQAYAWGSQILNTSGTYTEHFTTINGCDSIATLILAVTAGFATSDTQTICNGTSYSFGTLTLISSGSYTQHFTSSAGCDSVVTLYLTVLPAVASSISATICSGVIYTFGPQTLTTSGQYTQRFTAAAGCDSIVTLTLTIQSITTTSSSLTICQGDSFELGTQVLYSAGVYSDTLTTLSGCDSIVTVTIYFDTTQICDNHITFVIPTAFSPNGDNKNDLFYPVFISPNTDSLISFSIYDRWGQLIYNDPRTGWDGNYLGQPQPQGVYTCFVEVYTPDPLSRGQTKEIHKQGTFTLFR